MKTKQTHETYIMAIRDAVLHRVGKTDREKLEKARMVYGAGVGTMARGLTYFELWKHEDGSVGDVIEICLYGEENPLQIAGTVLHEMGHVLCNHLSNEGHGPFWKEACHKLGLKNAQASAMQYTADVFDKEFAEILARIPAPQDGTPGQGKRIAFVGGRGGCKAGQGTKGGKSRGVGSGSRNRKVICPDKKCGYTVRTTQKWIDVGLPTCPCGMKMETKDSQK